MPPRKKLVILRRAKKLYTTLPGFWKSWIRKSHESKTKRAHIVPVPMDIGKMLWTPAFLVATQLDGLVPFVLNGKEDTRYVHWCGKNPDSPAP
jgi:hypothetical protein